MRGNNFDIRVRKCWLNDYLAEANENKIIILRKPYITFMYNYANKSSFFFELIELKIF